MKKLEKILIIIALIGFIFMLIPFPGGSILIILSLSMITILYFLLSYALFNNLTLKDIFKKESYMEIKPLRIIGTIGLGFGLSYLTLGILFMLMHWSLGKMYIIIGLIISMIVLVVSFIRYSKTKSKLDIIIIKRIVLFSAFGIFLILAPKYWMTDIKYRKNPEFLELLKKSYENPDNMELKKEVEEERLRISLESPDEHRIVTE